VSVSEPEAHMMKTRQRWDRAELQSATDNGCRAKVIVTKFDQVSSDSSVHLVGSGKQVEANTGCKPDQVVADGGFTNRKNIIEMADACVDFIGSLPDKEVLQLASLKAAGIAEEFAGDRFTRAAEGDALCCPAGQRLDYLQIKYKNGNSYEVYQAQGSDCTACEFHPQCCPKGFQNGRTVNLLKSEPPERIVAFLRGVANGEAALSGEIARRLLDQVRTGGRLGGGVPDGIAKALSAREVEVLLLLDEPLDTDDIA
jgi:hypothetical protein